VANAAALIGAIASLVTALFGVGVWVWTQRASSKRERQAAAEKAAMKVIDPTPAVQQLINEAVEEYLKHREGESHD
jgi:HAMP domain-containing protein